MTKEKTILIIANLDTRGGDFIFVKDLIKKKGHRPFSSISAWKKSRHFLET